VTNARILDLRQVGAWRRASTNRRIFAAMVIVAVGTLAAKLVGMAKDMVVAAHFGTSDAMDAFLVALALPTFITNVVAGSLPSALVPVYIRVREREGRDAARRLLSSVLAGAIAVVVVASVLLVLFSPLLLRLIGSTFSSAKLALAEHLFVFLVPLILISGLSTILSAVLNADERFVLGAATPVLIGLMPMLFVITVGERWGIRALSTGLIAGYACEFLVLSWTVYRRGFIAVPTLRSLHPETKQVVREYLPMVLGMVVMSATPLVDQSMAAMLGPGSVSALTYGSKLVTAGLGIGVTALSTALFPHFSTMVAAGNWSSVQNTLRTYARLTLLVAIPLVAVFWLFSDVLVRALFERGAFSGADTEVVARVQALFALQIPFYVLGIIGVRLLSATGGNRLLMWISIGNFVTNIVGNYVFMQFWGVAGIALSTSLVYVVSSVAIYAGVRRRIAVHTAARPA